jgi:hypothetical protein
MEKETTMSQRHSTGQKHGMYETPLFP